MITSPVPIPPLIIPFEIPPGAWTEVDVDVDAKPDPDRAPNLDPGIDPEPIPAPPSGVLFRLLLVLSLLPLAGLDITTVPNNGMFLVLACVVVVVGVVVDVVVVPRRGSGTLDSGGGEVANWSLLVLVLFLSSMSMEVLGASVVDPAEVLVFIVPLEGNTRDDMG